MLFLLELLLSLFHKFFQNFHVGFLKMFFLGFYKNVWDPSKHFFWDQRWKMSWNFTKKKSWNFTILNTFGAYFRSWTSPMHNVDWQWRIKFFIISHTSLRFLLETSRMLEWTYGWIQENVLEEIYKKKNPKILELDESPWRI